MNLSSSAITSDPSTVDNEEQLAEFSEPENEENYNILAFQDCRDDEPQFTKRTFEEFVSA